MATMATTTTKEPTTSSSTLPRAAGPLTTVFQTPDFCAPTRWSATATPALSSSICMPPDFLKYHDYKYGMYSPGICPMGYTEGCPFPTSLAGTTNGTPFFGGTLMPGETARICCPQDYTCYTGTDRTKAYSECIWTKGKTTFLGYNYGLNTYVTTTTDALVFAIQVRWKSSDLSNLETDPTVPGSKYSGPRATTTGGGVSAQGGSGTSPGSVDESGGDWDYPVTPGISRNAMIAVGVVVPLVSLALGLLAFFFWRRHYKRKYAKPPADDDNNKPQEVSSPTTSESRSGLLGSDLGQGGAPSAMAVSPMTPRTMGFGSSTTELDSGTVNEMDATTINEADAGAGSQPWMELETREKASELPSTSFVAELPGSDPPADWKRETRRDTDSHMRQRSGSGRESIHSVKKPKS